MFCLFWSQNWRTFYHLLLVKFCPNFLPFLEPKLQDFFSLFTHKMLPKYFAFFGAIIVLEDFLRLATYEFLPNFLAFFGAKIGGLETHDYTIFVLILCPFWSPKWRTFYHSLQIEEGSLPNCVLGQCVTRLGLKNGTKL